jgi:hypothetical protein
MKKKPAKTKTTPATKSLSMKVEDSLNNEFRHLKAKLGAARDKWESEQDEVQKRIYWNQYQSLLDAVTKLAKVAPKSDIEQQQSLPASDVEAAWSRMLQEFKSMLEQIPMRVATLPAFSNCDPVDVEQTIAKEINAALEQLSAGAWLKQKKAASAAQ